MTLNQTEQPECVDYHLFSCFSRWAYALHQHRAGIPAPHRNRKRVRVMLPAFAENNLVTIQLFNSACSRTAQSSVRHVRKYSRATACSGVAGSFYGYDPNKMIGGRKMLSAYGDRKRTTKAIKESETRTRIWSPLFGLQQIRLRRSPKGSASSCDDAGRKGYPPVRRRGNRDCFGAK